jgi:serine/threonine-protein kinase RsbW
MPQTKQIILTSDLDELQKLESFLDEVCMFFDVHEDVYPDIMLAVTEATTNAIIHGNEFDPEKEVQIRVVHQDSELAFTVADQGKGFDPNNLPNPVEEDNLLKSGGRGVYLIRHYAHEVRFNAKGNEITMLFKTQPNE